MLRLMEELGRLPGIGAKTAERLAYHILRAPEADALRLADTIRDLKKNTRNCTVCYNITESDPCAICADPGRDKGIICVVEQPKDLIALERTGAYSGVYHVLMGHIAPLEGVEPEQLTIAALVERIKKGGVRELVMATNPNLDGDATALYIQREIAGLPVKVTRIARGLPTGSSIEHANVAMLSDAITGRHEVR
jgi:recombination protein RecR